MLHDWTHLFDITGAAGVELIGLLFVVVTLGTGLSARQERDAIRAFITPTVVNFSAVLFEALIMLTPWDALGPSLAAAGVLLVLGGLAGLAYRIRATLLKVKVDIVRLRGINWIAYNGVPMLANLGVIAGGVGLYLGQAFAPFAIAGASALQLAAGIFGAWDVTLWMLTNRKAG